MVEANGDLQQAKEIFKRKMILKVGKNLKEKLMNGVKVVNKMVK